MTTRRWIAAAALFAAVAGASATAGALTSQDDAGRAAQAGPVSVFPVPGTPTAAAATEVSLRGVAPDALGAISVEGSASGPVAGTVAPHSDGRGASFVPAAELQDGERVTVRTALTVRGARDGDFAFTIGNRPEPYEVDDGELVLPDPPPGNARKFRSAPDLRAPRVEITRRSSRTAPGDLFLSPVALKADPKPNGPMIVDDAGELVWFQQADPRRKVFDFKVQEYRGKPVLTWWEGRFALGWGYGEYTVLDQAYQPVARISAGNGYRGDFHDMRITDRGTALVTVYDRVERDLRSVGGPREGVVIDNVIQELDVETGRVLFEWHSVGNVPLRESRTRPSKEDTTWDYFHANSIEVDRDGDLLISARNTCALYKLDRETGELRWTLGGRGSDFRMGKGSKFCFQHDARRVSPGVISLFDNAAGPPATRPQSRGLVLGVDERRMRVRRLRQYTHPERFSAPNQGSTQVLDNGNVLVGWGASPVFTEYAPGGKLLFNGRLLTGKGTYRAFRGRWTGRPATVPSVAAQRRGGRTAVWASWNGATQVRRWEALAGPAPDALRERGGARRDGFETAMSVPGRPAYVAVRAVGPGNRVLATSEPVRAGG